MSLRETDNCVGGSNDRSRWIGAVLSPFSCTVAASEAALGRNLVSQDMLITGESNQVKICWQNSETSCGPEPRNQHEKRLTRQEVWHKLIGAPVPLQSNSWTAEPTWLTQKVRWHSIALHQDWPKPKKPSAEVHLSWSVPWWRHYWLPSSSVLQSLLEFFCQLALLQSVGPDSAAYQLPDRIVAQLVHYLMKSIHSNIQLQFPRDDLEVRLGRFHRVKADDTVWGEVLLELLQERCHVLHRDGLLVPVDLQSFGFWIPHQVWPGAVLENQFALDWLGP